MIYIINLSEKIYYLQDILNILISYYIEKT